MKRLYFLLAAFALGRAFRSETPEQREARIKGWTIAAARALCYVGLFLFSVALGVFFAAQSQPRFIWR